MRVQGLGFRIQDARLLLIAASAAVFVAVAACGGDDDDDNGDGGDSPEEVVTLIEDAVLQPGMVFHAEGDDGSEVWLDPENQRYRRQEATQDGGLTSHRRGLDALPPRSR